MSRGFSYFFWVVVSNIFYFQPYLGKIPNLTNIFERGWNHQPVLGLFQGIMANPLRIPPARLLRLSFFWWWYWIRSRDRGAGRWKIGLVGWGSMTWEGISWGKMVDIWYNYMKNSVVATQIFFDFHPETWGNDSQFDEYFSGGLKPPTRKP